MHPPLRILSAEEIAGHPVRFLAPPQMPDLPWCSWIDLVDATGASDLDRVAYSAVLLAEWKDKIYVDQDGNVYVPANMVGGFVLTMIEAKKFPASALIELHSATEIAVGKLTAGMSKHDINSYRLGMHFMYIGKYNV